MLNNTIPFNLKYTKSHEWIREEGNGAIVLGITDHAQELLGEVVFIELPKTQDILKHGDAFIVVESIKAAADIYAPISGEVIAINEKLMQTPRLVNTDPYGEGWLCRILMTEKIEIVSLMDLKAYKLHISN